MACAPTTDLKLPVVEPQPRSGRLVVLQASTFPIPAEDSEILAATRESFWADFGTEMRETYGFQEVDVRFVSDLVSDTLTALVEKPRDGFSGTGWRKTTLLVPRGVMDLAPEADAVIVVRDAFVENGLRRNGIVVGIGGIGVPVPLPSGRGVTIGADVMVFPGGASEPSATADVVVYGRGGGLFENRVDERSTDRAVSAFAERLAAYAGFARR